MGTGWLLTAVAIYHIAMRGFGSADAQVIQDDIYVTSRPLVSSQAFVVLAAALNDIGRGRLRPRTAVFILVALISQHRSVWVAGIVALLPILLVASTSVRARFLWVASFLLTAGFAFVTRNPSAALVSDLSTPLQSRGTLNARTDGWAQLVSQQNDLGLFTILVGQPVGSGFARSSGGGLVLCPHNWYVTLYLRIGMSE